MYPAPFEYVRATSWQDAVELLAEHGDDAKVLAGGQSLVPLMGLRLASPSHIVDVNEVDAGEIRRLNGSVEIPALARHAELERSPIIAAACPLIAEAAALIGNVRVRHRGTIGGSLAHADPSGELPCALLALEGTIHTLGPDGERRIPAGSFFHTYFTTALAPSEVVVAVEVPAAGGRTGSAFEEFAHRAGDFAVVEVAAVVGLDDDDRCRSVRVAVGGVSNRPLDQSEQAGDLLGTVPNEEGIAGAVRGISDAIDPRGDHRATPEYRTRLVKVLARRALVRAWRRAIGTEP